MESFIDVGVGFALPWIANLLSPVTNWLSSFLGNWANEASLLIGAAVAYKMLPAGIMKQIVRELYRAGLMSVGAQANASFVGNGTLMSAGSASSSVGYY